jgi:hypothetical protein
VSTGALEREDGTASSPATPSQADQRRSRIGPEERLGGPREHRCVVHGRLCERARLRQKGSGGGEAGVGGRHEPHHVGPRPDLRRSRARADDSFGRRLDRLGHGARQQRPIAFDTTKFLTNPACALLSETPVGQSPVGHAFVAGGAAIAVANSFRFETPVPNGTIMIVDTAAALSGSSSAVKGQVTVGQFPREMSADPTSLFVSNFDAMTLSGIDLTNLPK